MKFKWIIGKKTNYFLTVLWSLFAVIDFVNGHWLSGVLQAALASYALNDALRGEEVTLLDIKIGKAVK